MKGLCATPPTALCSVPLSTSLYHMNSENSAASVFISICTGRRTGMWINMKVAIILNRFDMGGIPKACISFINQLSDFYDVTLITQEKKEALETLLPPNIIIQNLYPIVFRDVLKIMHSEHKHYDIIKYTIQYLFYSRVTHNWVRAHEIIAQKAGFRIPDTFDCVISYHGLNIRHIMTALYSVEARKRIVWVHGQHSYTNKEVRAIEKICRKFDKIYCVSPVMLERFVKDFPSVVDISESYKNILEVEKIKELSNEQVVSFDDSFVNLVTVGRVSREKGQDLIPKATKLLLDKGLKIRWYIIGDGDDTERIKKLCCDERVEDSVIFVGAKQNPYPYMKNCDIYVQPSYTEGYCLTVCEAAILAKPIVLTAAAAAGILVDGENTIVTEANAESIADGIQRMIENPDMQQCFTKNLNGVDLSNRDEIKKLISFLNT